MTISIVIVTYNSLHLIQDCLDSIFKYNDIGDCLDVIIVDNASNDQDELFRFVNNRYNQQQVRLYDAGINGGYGKGNNWGISHTNSDLIIVMNPDVRIISPIFLSIIKEFEDSSLGMAGVEFIDGSNPYYFKPEYNSFFHDLFIHLYTKRRKFDANKMYMSGSLMIFNRKTIIEAGLYDENIFMYCEEPDITNRIQKTGKKIKWLKGTMVLHLAHGRKFNQKLNDIANDSLEYYCKKYKLNPQKIYSIRKRILLIKLIVAKLLKDNHRADLFSNSLASINKRINSL